MQQFHPLVAQWFLQRFGEPTEAQRLGWPRIAEGRHTLVAAPTGSGKTLAAFLVCLDRLYRDQLAGELSSGIHVVYVSPLKALSNDIERNLDGPLGELRQLAAARGEEIPEIRVALRTGDTPASQRQAMLRRPPHILVTTPESLYLLLTSERSRELLRSARTLIVDEIHALARDKRGSHLSLSMERLAALADGPLVRIGLSATQRPIDEIAGFLVGAGGAGDRSPPDCAVIDAGHLRDLDLAISTPPTELDAVCSHEQWAEIHEQLKTLIESHRSTLVFVNTRRMAERIAHHLSEILGERAVASHHGSLSRPLRLSAEQRLKSGELRAIVATASLEMGIDIGYIDLVCQIGSPRCIATFLQRIGRSGHTLHAQPRGRLFPLTRDELLECMALIRAVRLGELDRIEIPVAPLDILAQQIVAAVACEPYAEDDLYRLCRKAWPYRGLSRGDFDETLRLLSEGVAQGTRRGVYLHRDRINHHVRARRSARLAAITSGGAIPENADYRVVAEPDQTLVGTVDEDFAIESLAGDVFLLGNTSWRIRYVRGGEVIVSDAEGAPPTVPFWLGEAPGRTAELSRQLSALRREIVERAGAPGDGESRPDIADWLHEACGAGEAAALQAVRYCRSQVDALGLVPTADEIVYERFFDESGGMQLVIHAPLGARINRAWGLALRKRFCRSFDFELQAAATDNGILLSLSPQHSFPVESLFKMLGPHNGRQLLEQAVLAVPMFQVRWRWNVTRALAVLRSQNGKKVPPYLQRFRSDDLLAAAFPETVGCLENHHGDVEIPDHPLVRQTMHDCLHEAMDVDAWLAVLEQARAGTVKLVARDTREPSPFAHELLNASPYAFLDDAALEERRTRAVASRGGLQLERGDNLARLDPGAIEQVRAEAWPVVRDSEELHDALHTLVLVRAGERPDWTPWFEELVRSGRAARVRISTDGDVTEPHWVAAERWPVVRAVYDDASPDPPIVLPPELDVPLERSDGWVELVRGFTTWSGPTTAPRVAAQLHLDTDAVWAALEALEARGIVLRGRFSPDAPDTGSQEPHEIEWCDRRLLARIHRLTLEGLRRGVRPVDPPDFIRFLFEYHQVERRGTMWSGPVGTRRVVEMLEGFELSAGAWERKILAARLPGYDSDWLDHLFQTGEVVWGRLSLPRRDDTPRRAHALNRTVPISIMLRSDLPWLLPPDRDVAMPQLRSYAQQVLEALEARGALFHQELAATTQLLPSHLDEALRELAAAGRVTSDGFHAVRSIAGRDLFGRGRRPSTAQGPAGRWSRFPSTIVPADHATRVGKWCELLVRRYGVVFRDLVTRESAAPGWSELVRHYRRMELRGEVRGGRFVSGVAGEQYASNEAVARLRVVRDTPCDGEWKVISAADPLNLAGIITDETRVPARGKNALVVRDGRCVAFKQAGVVEFVVEVEDAVERAEMRRALVRDDVTRQAVPPPADHEPAEA